MSEYPKLITPVFRVAFPMLDNPQDRQPDKEGYVSRKYSVTAIWRPADFTDLEKEQWAAIKAALDVAVKETFKKTYKQLLDLNQQGGNYKLAPRSGLLKELTGFGEGTEFAALNANYRPHAVDQDRKPIENIEAAFYAGCYARASVRPYTFNNQGKGVALGMNGLQFMYDGERLDAGGTSSDDFDVEVEEKYRKLAVANGHAKAAADFGDAESNFKALAAKARRDVEEAIDDKIPF